MHACMHACVQRSYVCIYVDIHTYSYIRTHVCYNAEQPNAIMMMTMMVLISCEYSHSVKYLLLQVAAF